MKVQTQPFKQSVSKQRGSAVLWGLLGLLGFTALAWFCVARHVPVLEQRLQTSVLGAIKPLNAGNVTVEMDGYVANLNGAVRNSTARDSLVAAAGSIAGVRAVNNNLKIIASPVSTSVDNTAIEGTNPAGPEATAAEADPEVDTANENQPEPSAIVAPVATAEATQATAAEEPDTAQEIKPSETAETNTPASVAPAELNIAVADRTLTLTGRVQDQRELRPIVESVMTTFDLNYVSNKTTASESIAPMDWMDGLVTTVPELSSIKNPSIDVFDQQITLGGTVESEEEKENIIESVRNNLSGLSLVGRLRVEESLVTEVTSTEEAESPNVENAAPETVETATAETNTQESTTDSTDTTAATNTTPETTGTDRQAAIEEEFRLATQQRQEAEARAAAEAEANAEAQAEQEAAAEAERAAAETQAAQVAAEAETAAAEAQAAKEAAETQAAKEAADAERAAAETQAAKEAAEAERAAAEALAAKEAAAEAERAAAEAQVAKEEAERAAAEALAAQQEAERAAVEAARAAEDPVTTASNELSAAFSSLPNTQILFQSGSDVFTRDSEDRLDQIAELLSDYPIVPVDIKGHTDSQGDDATNLALSQLRANAVRDYLASKGISVFRLSSFGYGESLPIASNDTPDGRAANRRIEFSF